MHRHTISHGGRSYSVDTPTHVDDHPSHEDWIQRNSAYITAAASIATVANVFLTHKPRR